MEPAANFDAFCVERRTINRLNSGAFVYIIEWHFSARRGGR